MVYDTYNATKHLKLDFSNFSYFFQKLVFQFFLIFLDFWAEIQIRDFFIKFALISPCMYYLRFEYSKHISKAKWNMIVSLVNRQTQNQHLLNCFWKKMQKTIKNAKNQIHAKMVGWPGYRPDCQPIMKTMLLECIKPFLIHKTPYYIRNFDFANFDF